VTLQKYFSHPSLVIHLFFNLAHKTKTGTANRWETTNSKPLGPIIMIGKSETGSSSQILFITLVWQVLGFAVPFTNLSRLCKNAGPKPFCLANPTCVDFSSSNVNLHSHILSTSGVALRINDPQLACTRHIRQSAARLLGHLHNINATCS